MYLAILCNSKVIEIVCDIIRVSHGFEGCQPLAFIADVRYAPKTENEDIINIYGVRLVQLCWSNHSFILAD
jgi:hypothetical protein